MVGVRINVVVVGGGPTVNSDWAEVVTTVVEPDPDVCCVVGCDGVTTGVEVATATEDEMVTSVTSGVRVTDSSLPQATMRVEAAVARMPTAGAAFMGILERRGRVDWTGAVSVPFLGGEARKMVNSTARICALGMAIDQRITHVPPGLGARR